MKTKNLKEIKTEKNRSMESPKSGPVPLKGYFAELIQKQDYRDAIESTRKAQHKDPEEYATQMKIHNRKQE